MGISRASYYHKPIKEDLQIKRDMELRGKIEKIHVDFPGYGYRRIREQLLRDGITVNTKRIRRVMKTYSLFSSVQKLFKQRGVRLGKRLVFPNLESIRKLWTKV